ncbi:MAG: HlyD family efflux transporter periplasmic adaptor subunit [Elainellaceae cyanobacterium]
MKESLDPKVTNGQSRGATSTPNGRLSKTTPPSSNGHSGLATTESAVAESSSNSDSSVMTAEPFDQPVILQQTPLWTRGIVIGIIGVVSFGVLWACLAKIEEAVATTGKLEPQGAVQEVDAPISGVVEEVLVEDGEQVRRGDLLVRLDPQAAQAEFQQLEEVRQSLARENQFYRAHLSGLDVSQIPAAVRLDLPPEVLLLTSDRTSLLEENGLFATLLTGGSAANLTTNQRIRLGILQSESQSRISAAGLEVEGLRRQLNQVESQLASAQQTLSIEQNILDSISPLVAEGAIAGIQEQRQQVETLTRRAELERLLQEKRVIESSIAQAQQQLNNTVALSQSDILSRIAENDKRLAEIDSNLTKRIVDNDKQISELESQLSQTNLTLEYQEIRAPIDGTVFEVQPQAEGYINSNDPEPIMKIVPSENLVARVFITNQDIGFVSEGMIADVRIDSFPFSEFGDIEGELVWIGSDALPPDQQENRPVYTFPAKVQLDQQYLNVGGRPIDLQSGMSVSVNVKIRKRRVITIFTDLFSRKVESLKTTR